MVFDVLSVPAAGTTEGLLNEMQRVLDSYRTVGTGLLSKVRQWFLENRFTGLLAVAKLYRIEGEERSRYTNIVNSYEAVYAVTHDTGGVSSHINTPLIG